MGIKINLKSQKIEDISLKIDIFWKKSDILYTTVDIFMEFIYEITC